MKILYVKNNSQRARRFQLKTIVYEENGQKYVKKQALCNEAIPHLKKMKYSYDKLSASIINPKIKLAKIIDESHDSLTFEFIDGESLDCRFYKAKDKMDSVIKEYQILLDTGFKTTKFDSTTMVNDEMKELFGDIDYSQFDGEICFDGISNIDLIFSNIIYSGGDIFLIDYEWVFQLNILVDYVKIRKFVHTHEIASVNILLKNMELVFLNLVNDNYRFFYQQYNNRRTTLEEKDRMIEEKDRMIEEILNSKSWKITEPLRSLMRIIER